MDFNSDHTKVFLNHLSIHFYRISILDIDLCEPPALY